MRFSEGIVIVTHDEHSPHQDPISTRCTPLRGPDGDTYAKLLATSACSMAAAVTGCAECPLRMSAFRGAGKQGWWCVEGGRRVGRTGFGVFEIVTVMPASRLNMFIALTGNDPVNAPSVSSSASYSQQLAPYPRGSGARSCYFS